MIEQLAAALMPAVATNGPVNDPPVLVAQAGDVERFRAAMISPQTAVAAPELQLPAVRSALSSGPVDSTAAAAVAPVAARQAGVDETPSIGQSILTGLRSAADDTRDRYKHIAEVLTNPSPSISDLMALQFVVLQNSLQFELTSKLISKAPQTIDTIVKTQ